MSEELKDRIANLITVGLRKGVDGEGSGEYHSVLNSAFFNTDERIRKAAYSHVNAIGNVVATIWDENPTDETLGLVMKQAASVLVTQQPGERKFTPDNEGKAMLIQLMPIDFEWYGERRLAYAPSDYKDGNQTPHMREQILRDGKWENNKYLDEENQMYIGAVLLKLVEEIPAVKEYFAESLNDRESDFRHNLQKVAIGMTDDGWKYLANWIKDCLKL
jgi:hypothetical protein